MYWDPSPRRGRSLRILSAVLLAAAVACVGSPVQAQERVVYTLSNGVEDGSNAVIAYRPLPNGELQPHPAGPFPTGGTGINNDTNGKLGPNDNDTPLAVSADRRYLFAVNGHSNSIAAFRIQSDGALTPIAGSPFPSRGVAPVSLSVSQGVLLVANRNEDPHQLSALRGGVRANYASFRIEEDGGLSFIGSVDVEEGQKPTQVLVSSRNPRLAFGNDFRVDVDFDDDGPVSRLFGNEPAVNGGLRSFQVDHKGRLEQLDHETLPETVEPAPEVPSIPLGIWDHPTQPLLYVGLVTRNQLGVYSYDDEGDLSFVTAVPNSGQDICWLKTSSDGTRLFAVNNLPREDQNDQASTVTVFDIAGERAREPVEIGRVELPLPYGTFVNNRNAPQPGSAAFQFDMDEENGFLYVIAQRIDQTSANRSDDGNVLHTIR
ncbi:MAG: beta-propeller fold lactonase family protein, partial [Gemmatimonadetes bacterium]|nr:beta-propeller fold lactonase family protein [Gemmatimonadota bacterium]